MITKLLSLALLSNMYAFNPSFCSKTTLNNYFGRRQKLELAFHNYQPAVFSRGHIQCQLFDEKKNNNITTPKVEVAYNNTPVNHKHDAIDIPEVQQVTFNRPTRKEYENFAKTFKEQPSICNTGAVRSLIQLRSEKLQAQDRSVKNALKTKLASAQKTLYGAAGNLKQHAYDAWITAQKAGNISYNHASPYVQQGKQVCSTLTNHAQSHVHQALKEGQKLEQNMVKEYKKSQKLAEKKYLAAKKQTKKMYRNTLKAAQSYNGKTLRFARTQRRNIIQGYNKLQKQAQNKYLDAEKQAKKMLRHNLKAAKSYNGKALRFARTRKGLGVAGLMLGAGAATAGTMTYNAFTQPARITFAQPVIVPAYGEHSYQFTNNSDQAVTIRALETV